VRHTDPRWLDAAEMRAWLRLLRVVMLLPGALDRQLRQDAGLTHASYMVLACLSDAPDRSMRMSDLARVTATSQSRLSHAVAALEQRGWVQRRPCPDDRRGSIAWLTDDGVQVLVDTAPGHAAKVRDLVFDPLDREDVEHLAAVAERIVDRLEADSSGALDRGRT
jgi:DNA-binding MarR family transcriptional regulator